MDKKIFFKEAFKKTIPTLFGYAAIGISYGLLMQVNGYAWYWSLLSSVIIYAGAMQMAAIPLMLTPFMPFQALVMALIVNARYLFYSLSLMTKFREAGRLKAYLLYGLSDETYSLYLSAEPPTGADSYKFYGTIAFLNQIYWFVSVCLGGLIGDLITFNTAGIDFAMTALFITVVIGQLENMKSRGSTILGFILSIITLMIVGEKYFILVTMTLIAFISITMSKGGSNDEAN